jgi:hypothetical protein
VFENAHGTGANRECALTDPPKKRKKAGDLESGLKKPFAYERRPAPIGV